MSESIGVARGAVGASAPPHGGEKNRRNLQGKFVSATPSTPSAPQAEQESIFKNFFLLGGGELEVVVVHLVVLDRFDDDD